ncbi:MAG: DUF4426 domain-containing protein [Porticoccaceae bacterium]|nr:DUF4426 domain-containing protein [Porticoccaceae bacterium]
MKHLIWVSCLMAIVGLTQAAEDNLFKQHGDFKVFFSAFGSSFLTPEVAVANNIVRGKGKGLVNIAVVKNLGAGTSAEVYGKVFNILQQTQILEFTEVREQDTRYYLAPFNFDNEDFLTFKITVRPNVEDGTQLGAYEFKFQKKMYHD